MPNIFAAVMQLVGQRATGATTCKNKKSARKPNQILPDPEAAPFDDELTSTASPPTSPTGATANKTSRDTMSTTSTETKSDREEDSERPWSFSFESAKAAQEYLANQRRLLNASFKPSPSPFTICAGSGRTSWPRTQPAIL